MKSLQRALRRAVTVEARKEHMSATTSLSSIVGLVQIFAIEMLQFLVPIAIALVMAEIPAGSFRLWAILSVGWLLASSFPLTLLSMRFRSRVSSWSRGKSPAERVLARLVVWGAYELAMVSVLLEIVMFRSGTHRLLFPIEVVAGVFLVALVVLHPLARRLVLPHLTDA